MRILPYIASIQVKIIQQIIKTTLNPLSLEKFVLYERASLTYGKPLFLKGKLRKYPSLSSPDLKTLLAVLTSTSFWV
ncbi:MAG: hypothetical protein AAF208_05495 [Cyanobacteria bacterium P01_A01_bin.45]